jgi:hypothetical protein
MVIGGAQERVIWHASKSTLLTGGIPMKHLVTTLALIVMSSQAIVSSNAAPQNARVILVQGSQPEVCIQIYQPVCGTDQDGKRVTYSNACFARVAKAINVTAGECPK